MAEVKNGPKEAVKTAPDSKKTAHSLKSSTTSSPSAPKKSPDLVSYKVKLLDGDQKPLEISISVTESIYFYSIVRKVLMVRFCSTKSAMNSEESLNETILVFDTWTRIIKGQVTFFVLMVIFVAMA